MSPLPDRIPDDLRLRLEEILGFRGRAEPVDLYRAFKEWIEAREGDGGGRVSTRPATD